MSGDAECHEQQQFSGDDVEAFGPTSLPIATTVTPLKCYLGVDKATGRVKWCPDCKFIKYLLVFPVILLPIIVVLILTMQISNSFTGRIEIVPATERIKKSIGLEPHHRQSRNAKQSMCLAFQHISAESFDIYEQELFRNIRTSFIPPDPFLMPKNCLNYRESSSNSNVNTNNRSNHSINGDDDNDGERKSKTNQLTSIGWHWVNDYTQSIDFNNNVIENDISDLSSTKRRERRHIQWNDEKQENTNNDNIKSVVSVVKSNKSDASEDDLDEKPNEIPAVLKTFWKGGKTWEQIRHSQVEIMNQYMDTKVHPCDDFYQYACGNWEKLNPIPKDKAAYDTFELLREILDIELNTLLAEGDSRNVAIENDKQNMNSTEKISFQVMDLPNTIDAMKSSPRELQEKVHQKRRSATEIISAEQKAKFLYQSCMNSEILQRRGLAPLQKLLKSMGGWPVLEPHDWNATAFDWLHLAAHLRLYNNDVFLLQWVGPDIKNSEENVIQFDQTSLGLPTRDYFMHTSNIAYLEAYREYAKQVMVLCGATENDSVQTSDAILKFEIGLATITASPEERLNVSQLYRRMTIDILYQHVPAIDWQRYLEIVLEHPVNRNETVVVFAMTFMHDLVDLLNRTDSRTIANYMFWKFVRHRINNLDDRFQAAKQKFYNVLVGREKSPPRWKTCVNQVNSNMGMAVGAMFVRKYFDEKSKQDTMAMTHELQDSFREILNETDWIDDNTKFLAELKVNSMSLKIGYPDYILNTDDLDAKYADLDIHPEKYFENILNVLLHLTRSEQSKLTEKVNRTAWNTAPAVVNAYYSRNKNQIMFPAGILQPPFYHRHLPRSFNFGGIGVVIGHELTHGFDDKGRLFDRDGNINRWWSETAIEQFHQRAHCLISQYGNYKMNEIGGLAVDGTITQDENIADNGGIKQAFRAYEKWLRMHCQSTECIEQERLQGLNATNKQLFFINFAQVWCGAMRPEATKNKMKTAVHSPGRFRVIGTLSNSKEFAREFQCGPDTPMNPANKCSVW